MAFFLRHFSSVFFITAFLSLRLSFAISFLMPIIDIFRRYAALRRVYAAMLLMPAPMRAADIDVAILRCRLRATIFSRTPRWYMPICAIYARVGDTRALRVLSADDMLRWCHYFDIDASHYYAIDYFLPLIIDIIADAYYAISFSHYFHYFAFFHAYFHCYYFIRHYFDFDIFIIFVCWLFRCFRLFILIHFWYYH